MVNWINSRGCYGKLNLHALKKECEDCILVSLSHLKDFTLSASWGGSNYWRPRNPLQNPRYIVPRGMLGRYNWWPLLETPSTSHLYCTEEVRWDVLTWLPGKDLWYRLIELAEHLSNNDGIYLMHEYEFLYKKWFKTFFINGLFVADEYILRY